MEPELSIGWSKLKRYWHKTRITYRKSSFNLICRKIFQSALSLTRLSYFLFYRRSRRKWWSILLRIHGKNMENENFTKYGMNSFTYSANPFPLPCGWWIAPLCRRRNIACLLMLYHYFHGRSSGKQHTLVSPVHTFTSRTHHVHRVNPNSFLSYSLGKG